MKTLQFCSLRMVFAIVLAFAILGGSARAASAANGAETWKDRVESWESEGSCADPEGLYRITIVSSGVVHSLETEDGFKVSWSEHGTFTIEPIDADSPVTYSGRFDVNVQNHFGAGNFLYKYVSSSKAFGSDGTQEVMHIVSHLITTPNGIDQVVDHFRWVCN